MGVLVQKVYYVDSVVNQRVQSGMTIERGVIIGYRGGYNKPPPREGKLQLKRVICVCVCVCECVMWGMDGTGGVQENIP